MPPKKDNADKELKKKNTETAKSIITMLKQQKSNVEEVVVDSSDTSSAINTTDMNESNDTPMSEDASFAGVGNRIEKPPPKKCNTSKSKKEKPDLKRPSTSKISTSEGSSKPRTKAKATNSVGKTAKTFRYEIDCKRVEGSVNVKDLQRFVTEQLKVNGEKGNLGKNVTVSCEGQSVVINSKVFLPKKALRFLSKKFLKKTWNIQVISKNKHSYELKYVGTS